MDLFQRDFSGEAVKNLVTTLSAFHRIQLSPGYREAMLHCRDILSQHGLAPEILSYSEDVYWGWETFEGWTPKSGRLEICEPMAQREVLAEFSAIPISLIQRSPTVNLSNVEVVVIDDVTDLQKWTEVAPQGKLVLSHHANLDILTDCAIEYGAAGIITDRMTETPPVRYVEDLPEARMYSSFWWSKDETSRIPGFVISPQRGRLLRKQLQKGEEKGKPLRFDAKVTSQFAEEAIEVLSCRINGSEYPDQEIIVIAHLCHPSPGAGDNASGAALAVGLATFLQQQIGNGDLSPPKRTIRFLLVPEMTGTVPFLAQHQKQLDKFIAGINLDMVGQDQALCRSPLLIEGVSKALPTFVNVLIDKIGQRLPQEGKNFAGAKYPLYKLLSVPFSGGSDHLFLSDPQIGVATPMLIHWPDLYYHTSEDTPDKTDPNELKRVGSLAGIFVLFLANLDQKGVRWLSTILVNQLENDLNDLLDKFLANVLLSDEQEVPQDDVNDLEKQITDLVEYYSIGARKLHQDYTASFDKSEYSLIQDAMKQIGRERKDRLSNSLNTAQILRKNALEKKSNSSNESEANLEEVYRRQHPVIVSLRPYIARLDFKEKFQLRKKFDSYQYLSTGLVVAQYWINGERRLSEVITRTMQEVVVSREGLLWGINLLKRFKLISPAK